MGYASTEVGELKIKNKEVGDSWNYSANYYRFSVFVERNRLQWCMSIISQ